jgi:hypothetical protein
MDRSRVKRHSFTQNPGSSAVIDARIQSLESASLELNHFRESRVLRRLRSCQTNSASKNLPGRQTSSTASLGETSPTGATGITGRLLEMPQHAAIAAICQIDDGRKICVVRQESDAAIG